MALYYLETSALVKLYVQEPGTDRLLQLAANSAGNQFAVLAITGVEARSAIRRREREGDIDPKVALQILKQVQQHFEARFLLQAVTDTVLDNANEMIDRYALRAYDAVQLAGCLTLKSTAGIDPPTFVCADQKLLEAARSELLVVLDPTAPI